jgi:hypothetical protein
VEGASRVFESTTVTSTATATATVTMINHSTQSRLVTWTTPCLTILFMMGLLAFHVRAENPVETPMGGLWMRITSGPDALTSLDKVLFVAFILLGMEILSWVTEQWGSK